MTLDPFTVTIYVSGLLTGIAVSLLAYLVPDLPQAIRDLKRRRHHPPYDQAELERERAISSRSYTILAVLGPFGLLAFAIAVLA